MIGEGGKKEHEIVVWKVLNLSADSEGPIFAVWRVPTEADDTGMQLQV